MKRAAHLFLFACLALLAKPILSHANNRSIPALTTDKAIVQGKLENGIRYALWPSKEETGCYFVGLLQQDSLYLCQKIQTIQKESAADTALFQAFTRVKESIQESPDEFGTDNSLLFVAGDFKKQDIINRMEPLSIICPHSTSTWSGTEVAKREKTTLRHRCREIGDSTALISLDIYGTSFSPKMMGTILPTVSERSWFLVKQVLTRRLKINLSQADIPVGKISIKHQFRIGIDNCDRFNIKLAVPAQDSTAALQQIYGVLNALRQGGVSENEVECASGMYLIRQAEKQQFIESGKSKIYRLSHHFLYQKDLAPTNEKIQFFSTRKYDKVAEKKRFDRFAAHYLQLPEKWDSLSPIASAAPKINFEDSCHFALEGKKIKVLRSVKEGTTGGTLSFYENGTKTIYKKMDCKKRVYFSFIFDGGFSSLKHPEAAAYVEDVFASGKVNGYPMEDFLSLLAAGEIDIQFSADFSALQLHGSCPENAVSQLMKALVALTGHFTVDSALFPYLSRCEKTASHFFENSEDKLYASLFPQLHPGYAWTKIRPTHAPSEEVLAEAAHLIRKSFRDNGNSTLFLCGNISERRMQDKLRRFMGQFHTELRPQQRNYASMLTVSGTTRQGNFNENHHGMIVSSFDYDSGQAALIRTKIALDLFQKNLAQRLAPLGIRCYVTARESIRPTENLEITVKLSSATEEAFNIFKQCLHDMSQSPPSENALKLAKHDFEQQLLSFQKSAFYWTELIYHRIAHGKDYHNNRAKCLKDLSGEEVRQFCEQWKKAGRIENIYRKWDTDQASYR